MLLEHARIRQATQAPFKLPSGRRDPRGCRLRRCRCGMLAGAARPPPPRERHRGADAWLGSYRVRSR
eukprot:5359759-Alexandrium_andersonii.AAC.1